MATGIGGKIGQVGARLGKKAAANVFGVIESALLEIEDGGYQVKNTKEEGDAAAEQKPGAVKAGSGGKDMVVKTGNALKGIPNNPTAPMREVRVFKVQFNPAELTINASLDQQEGAAQASKSDTTSTKGRFTRDDSRIASTTLTLRIYFDDMSALDTFMWDKINSDPKQLALSMAKNKLGGKKGKKHYSVQPQVETLLCALQNPNTRDVTFRWADFSFSGTLDTVQAQYTLFSTSGRPVRAIVMLRIKQELDYKVRNIDAWAQAMDDAFGADGRLGLDKGLDKVGSLINLNL